MASKTTLPTVDELQVAIEKLAATFKDLTSQHYNLVHLYKQTQKVIGGLQQAFAWSRLQDLDYKPIPEIKKANRIFPVDTKEGDDE